MSVALMVGASLLGGAIQSRATGRAADAQASAARDAAAAQVEAARVGADALRDNTRMGLDAAREARDMALGYLGGGSDSAALRSLGNARQRSDNLVRSNTQDIIRGNNQAYGEQYRQLNPYASAGRNALEGLMFELGMGSRPDGYRGFQRTPGYDFRFNEAMRGVEGSAAARGGLLSGRTMEDMQARGMGLADQAYEQFLNRVTGVAGAGQNASNALASFAGARAAGNNAARANRMAMTAGNATNLGAARANIRMTGAQNRANTALGYGSQAANAYQNLGINLANNAQQMGSAQAQGFTDVGNAQSAGMIGQGNAWNNAIGNALGAYQFDQVYNNGAGMNAFAANLNAPFLMSPGVRAGYNAGGTMMNSIAGAL